MSLATELHKHQQKLHGDVKSIHPPSTIMLNLSTMHELESSLSHIRKQNLVMYLANVFGDAYPVSSLKL